jgi:hypothetical protein
VRVVPRARRGFRAVFSRWWALSAFCAAFVWATDGSAATVAILSTGASPALSEATFRLRGELSALRFEVLLLRRPAAAELGDDDARDWLERTAEARGLDAAIEVIGEQTTRAVDVWIFLRSPRRSQVARVVVEPDTPDRAGALAIRAIEVLRSYDLEAKLAREREREEDPAPPPPTPTEGTASSVEVAPRAVVAGRVGLELGAGIITGLDSVGMSLLPVLRFGWRAQPALLLHATVSGLGTRPTLRASAGTVRVAQSYAALGLCYCPITEGALGPYVSLAAGVARASLAGAAEAPARGHSVEQWSLLLDAGAGARWALPGRYYATLSGHVQVTQPRVTIYVVDDRIASTGRPSLVANLMVGAWL